MGQVRRWGKLAGQVAPTLAIAAVAFAQAGSVTYVTLGNPLVLSTVANRYISDADFNGDGAPDLLVGGDLYTDPPTPAGLQKTPIYLFINQGDGSV
jgi:hypothetical protein